MAFLLAVGLIANFLVRPVDQRFMEDPAVVQAKADADRESVIQAEAAAKRDGHPNGYSGGMHSIVSMVLALFIGASLLYGLWETIIKASGMFAG